MKKKVIKTICLGIFGAIFVATGLLWVGSVEAVEAQDDGLIVEYWTGTEWKKWLPGEESFPIFKEENFLPGDTVTRQVRVTNNSGQPQNIATEAINWPGFPNPEDVPDKDLSRALEITIREKEGSDLYGGSTGKKTLFDFYTKNGFNSTYEHVLTWGLPDGSEVIYEFEISFPSDKKNEWQGATTTFDILIGFQGVEGKVPPGTPPGGGGGGYVPGLTIKNEGAFYISTSTATITWQTSYFSTSKVIYDTQPGKFDLRAGEPSYGYSFYKEGDDSRNPKVTFHSVTLTGLTPNTTYYYRCVSHASPPTISREYSFTTLGVKEEAKEETGKKISEGAGEEAEEGVGRKVEEEKIKKKEKIVVAGGEIVSPLSFEKKKPIEEEKKEISEKEVFPGKAKPEVEEKPKGILNNLLARIGGFVSNSYILLIAIFVIALIVLIILRKRRKRKLE